MSPESERRIADLIGAYLGPAGSGERHDATHALRAHIEALESERDALRAECDRLRAALAERPIKCLHGTWCSTTQCKTYGCLLGSPYDMAGGRLGWTR